ncbi:hypothetical protein KW429_17325 [Vibrio fluvialis]|uniref:hypothetical protein n=1 Tax=Vibrio fluvialis TaxID=676 RepID=UPI001C9D8C94|nr:hypothetical protein [Vibrio fluvialis]MBY7855440.1 hypothetical protein [Vibrio fluvialis]MCG6358877.1 hypothetical protein [Vibrio fluvialis]
MSQSQLQKAKLHINTYPAGQHHEPLLTESDKKLIENEISAALEKGINRSAETQELKNMREVVAQHHGDVVANQLGPDALKSLHDQVTSLGGDISANSRYQGAPNPDEYLAGNFNPQVSNVPDPKDYFLGD